MPAVDTPSPPPQHLELFSLEMPSKGKDKEASSDAEIQGAVPRLMVQQAEAAAASENDPSDETEAQRRHQGHDVPTRT